MFRILRYLDKFSDIIEVFVESFILFVKLILVIIICICFFIWYLMEDFLSKVYFKTKGLL
jgi:hypothetical protein